MYSQQLELDGRYQSWDSESEAQPDEIDPFEGMDGPLDSPILGMSVAPTGQRVDRVVHVAAQGTSDALEGMGVTVVRTTFGEQ